MGVKMKFVERCEDLARRLVEVREAYGLKAKDVASTIGVNATTMSRFENGVRTPGLLQIRRLTEILPVNLHWLLTGRGSRVFREEEVAPFEVIQDDVPGEGRILVPGSDKADLVFQLKDRWMEPRIMENDFIFVETGPPSVNQLVAFRSMSNHVRAGWLRSVKGKEERYLEAEKPQNGNIKESKCDIIGRIVFSVRVDDYR